MLKVSLYEPCLRHIHDTLTCPYYPYSTKAVGPLTTVFYRCFATQLPETKRASLSYKAVDTKPQIFPARCYIVLPNIGLYYVSGFLGCKRRLCHTAWELWHGKILEIILNPRAMTACTMRYAILHTQEVTGSSPAVSTKRRNPETVGTQWFQGFFIFKIVPEISMTFCTN